MADLATLRAAAGELAENLGAALDMIEEGDRLDLTPEQADRADRLVSGYLQLAGIALERIEEATRAGGRHA